MKRAVLSAAFVAASVSMAAAQSFEGRYSVQGTSLDGSPYSGNAEIQLTSDTTCEIRWVMGPDTSTGICMRNGDSFAAGYEMNGRVGLVIYRIMGDGSLNGLWTVAGQPGGTEVLIPLR
jgi:hypothetical protein